MTHQYLATWFFDDETIVDCLNRNSISVFSTVSNTDDVTLIDYSKMGKIEYTNEYEREILEKNPKNNDYKIIKLKGEKYTGVMAVIYDPSRIEVVTTKYLPEDRSISYKYV